MHTSIINLNKLVNHLGEKGVHKFINGFVNDSNSLKTLLSNVLGIAFAQFERDLIVEGITGETLWKEKYALIQRI